MNEMFDRLRGIADDVREQIWGRVGHLRSQRSSRTAQPPGVEPSNGDSAASSHDTANDKAEREFGTS